MEKKASKQFIKDLNSWHPSIKFTAQWSSNSIPFLDTLVLCLSSYRMAYFQWTSTPNPPTHTSSYLAANSCHLHHCKPSIPFSQALRIHCICREQFHQIYKWTQTIPCTEGLQKILFIKAYKLCPSGQQGKPAPATHKKDRTKLPVVAFKHPKYIMYRYYIETLS